MQIKPRENITQSKITTKLFFTTIPVIQKKLEIGVLDDIYEVEADRMADRIVNMKSINTYKSNRENKAIQRKCTSCEEEAHVQKKTLNEQVTPLIQKRIMSKGGDSIASQTITDGINQSRGGGNTLDGATKYNMESGFGADFSKVRIHTDTKAINLSKQLNAQAFTVGNDIYFNEGKYRPYSNSGKHLLAHELTHTIQQRNHDNIQRQSIQEEDSCGAGNIPRSIESEKNDIIRVLNSGISDMQGYVVNPGVLIRNLERYNDSEQARFVTNLRPHIRNTISLAQELKNHLESRPDILPITIDRNPCNGVDACYRPFQNRIYLNCQIMRQIDKDSVSTILHEFKHFKQRAAHIQILIKGENPIIHSNIIELNQEYEGWLVGMIFKGDAINLPSVQPQQTEINPGRFEMRNGGNGSGVPFISSVGPSEVFGLAVRQSFGPNMGPRNLSDLPQLSRAYSSQIQRNAGIIYYPTEWISNERQARLLIKQRANLSSTIILLQNASDVTNARIIEAAFWDNADAVRIYEEGRRTGNYSRAIIVISNFGNKEIEIENAPSP